MAWHLDLRNYLYVSLMSILDEFPELFLCIISAICTRLVRLTVMPVTCPPFLPCLLRTPCRKLGKSRIGIDLHTPSGSVSQVDVHAVHLEHGHGIHLLLQEFHTAEMSGNIHMESTIWETREIIYHAAFQCITSIFTRGACNHLCKGLHCIELTFLR